MNILTVIAGYGNADVLPFVARAPLIFSEAAIFVDGIRPIIKRHSPLIKWDEKCEYIHSLDGTIDMCHKLGVKYVNPRKPLYNGEKINIGIAWAESRNYLFDAVLYLEGDEAIEPEDMGKLKHYISLHRKESAFMSFDMIELWKKQSGFKTNPSCSKIINNVHYKFPVSDEGHNSVQHISVKHLVEGVRLYHLHHFRQNAMCRVHNGIWRGGGDGGGIDIEQTKFKVKETELIKDIYQDLAILDRDLPFRDSSNTYVGEMNAL